MYGQVQDEQGNERKANWAKVALWKVEELNPLQNDHAISWGQGHYRAQKSWG